MDSVDVVDDVNALLKLGVGDPYRLEHIKQAYILNNTIWKSDDRYLVQLREKYLVRHRIDQPDIQPEIDGNSDNDSENKDMIHCWKCGKMSTIGANFCMVCGSSIFEVGTEPKIADVQMPSNSKNKTKSIGLKIPIMIGIPVLILIILGGAYSQGVFDNAWESRIAEEPLEEEIETTVSADKVISSGETNSKCGAGTVFDPETNSCVLGSEADSKEKVISSTDINSKCGAGTVFDSKTNSCVLE
jgi:hypothetical protein